MSCEKCTETASRNAIYDMLVRYCRAVDRFDYELLRSVYHEDALDDHGVYDGTAEGFIDRLEGFLGGFIATTHVLTNVVFGEISADAADVESYATAYTRMEQDGVLCDRVTHLRYLDRFTRRDGTWRIAHRRAVYDFSRIDAVDLGRYKAFPDGYLTGCRGQRDPSYAPGHRGPAAS
jgi:hypothetical protein